MADFLTFKNIYDAINVAIKTPKQTKLDYVKSVINMVYINEVLVADDLYPLFWLVSFDDTLSSVAPGTITAITKANPGVVTVDAAHGLVVGDLVTHHNIVGMTELNDRIQQVAVVPDSTSYSFGVNTSSYTAWASGGTVHHRGKTFSARVQKLLAAGWFDEDPMVEITYDEIEENTSFQYDDTTATPYRYYHGKGFNKAGAEINQVIWHPGSDAAHILRYWYSERPSRLVNDGDVPLLPPQFHDMIIAGAITRLAESNVQVENAVIWPGIYTAQLNALRSFNRKYYQEHDVAFRKKPYMM